MSFNELGISGVIILAFLGAWFLISIPNQFTNGIGGWVKRINVCDLIPCWTFFAPIPGTSDYRFVYRDVLSEGQSSWSEVVWSRPRSLLDAIWHPDRHRKKLVLDCINGLMKTAREMKKLELDTEMGLMISVPYMALLHVAILAPRTSACATARQFAIIEQKLGDHSVDSKVLVQSPFHNFQ